MTEGKEVYTALDRAKAAQHPEQYRYEGPKEFARILEELEAIYIRKNRDYGNSFSILFAKFGLRSTVIRLWDKVMRLETLIDNEPEVKDESVRDTLKDIAIYAVMTIMELDK